MDKKANFKRLAEPRTNEVLKKLKILGNCSNRSNYDYTEQDIRKIFSIIEQSVKQNKARFHFPKSSGSKFKL